VFKRTYRTASFVEYQAMRLLCRAGVTRVYIRFDWDEYGERSVAKQAEGFKPNEELCEAAEVVWSYLLRHLDLNLDIIAEELLFSGELGVEFSRGVPWGYFWGWARGGDWKKCPPDVNLQQEIEPATEVEKLLWGVQA